MTEESLGRAVAITALAPIAERLADQQAREAASREAAAAARRAEEAEVAALRISIDPRDIARLASAEDVDPQVVRQAWVNLVAHGAAGAPTHDLLAVRGKGGSYSRPPRFAELSRAPAWCAPGVGRHNQTGHVIQTDDAHDVWLDAEGTVWSPRNPGGLSDGAKDNRGRLIYSDLTIAVPYGTSLNTRRRGMYYQRRIDLIDGTVVAGIGFDHLDLLLNRRAVFCSAVAAILATQ